MRVIQVIFGILVVLVLAGCRDKKADEPPPTYAQPEAIQTRIALNQTGTAVQQMTLITHTPGDVATWTPSPTFTPFVRPTLTFTPSLSPTITLTETVQPTRTPTPTRTFTPSPTITLTPSDTPTRVLNPDGVVGDYPTGLLVEPSADSPVFATLEAHAALEIQARTADNNWLRVRLMNGQGNGWVVAQDIIAFIDIRNVPIMYTMAAPPPLRGGDDLMEPPGVRGDARGNGLEYAEYDFTACGDTYWMGDNTSYSMEDVSYQNRYPRFSVPVVRVYVHGEAADSPEWNLAISQTFAQLSQVIWLERVDYGDLDFFQPYVPAETLLADIRLEMVWHIVDPDVFEQSALCDSSVSCSLYAFDGRVTEGPIRFVGEIFVPSNSTAKTRDLIHAAIHALGLWVHSPAVDDIMSPGSTLERLSQRDIDTLRCLYAAPPYGDGRVTGTESEDYAEPTLTPGYYLPETEAPPTAAPGEGYFSGANH